MRFFAELFLRIGFVFLFCRLRDNLRSPFLRFGDGSVGKRFFGLLCKKDLIFGSLLFHRRERLRNRILFSPFFDENQKNAQRDERRQNDARHDTQRDRTRVPYKIEQIIR